MLPKYNDMLTPEEYQKYTKDIEQLLEKLGENTDMKSPEAKELDRLSEAVAAYEEIHFPFQPESLIEMIELRMYQRKLKQKDLARLLDTTPSSVSEILRGKRSLTMKLAKKLHQQLNIDAELILNG